jgi:hypothetical protein
MILRRLCSLVALGALFLSAGCCCHERRCCYRPILFPRLRGAYYERGCCEHGCCPDCCATCCHSGEFAGVPVVSTMEPAIAAVPLPMPRQIPVKPAN